MGRRTRAAPHLAVEEVKEKMIHDPRPLYRQRWRIIYNALVDPREAKEIAKDTGVSVATVHHLIPRYNALGVAAVETPGKGGRQSAYLIWEEEQQLLAPFFERAERGEVTTAHQIKQAFEEKVGHEVDESTISRLLKRHKWRKVMPRSRHPKAKKQTQKDFEDDFPNMVKNVEKTKDLQDDRPTLLLVQHASPFRKRKPSTTGMGARARPSAGTEPIRS